MKRLNQTTLGLCLLALSANACSNSAPVVTGTGGSSTGSGGSTGTGGTNSGSGGASTGSGGAAVGTGGVNSSGGTTGSGGTTNTGGDFGTTGGVTGSGGAPDGGVAGQVGSGGKAAGGTTGSGGTVQPNGGTTGTGGGTAGAPGGDLLSIVGSWDGALNLYPCQDHRSGYDCTNVNCTNGTLTTTHVWPIAGDAGKTYNVTFRVRGVVESYAYVGGTRASGTDSIAKGTSLFCVGGAQQPTTNGGDYNTYELDVSPPVPGLTNVVGTGATAANNYYLNSVIASENPHTSSLTQHLTSKIDYSATIKVTGGGKVTFSSYDSNCALVQNCGPTQGNMCQAPQTVSLAGAMPAAPASFMQPYQAPTGSYGQWVFFDVTDVTAAP